MTDFNFWPQSLTFSDLSATPPSFPLNAGRYGLGVMATWGGGSVQLNILAADNATWLPVVGAYTANGYSIVDLPGGLYQLAITTALGVYIRVSMIEAYFND